MVLEVDSDASYLELPKFRSKFIRYFRLLKSFENQNRSLYNGAILIIRKRTRHVVTSAVEAKTTGVFQNAKTALVIRNLLQHMAHCQIPLVSVLTTPPQQVLQTIIYKLNGANHRI